MKYTSIFNSKYIVLEESSYDVQSYSHASRSLETALRSLYPISYTLFTTYWKALGDIMKLIKFPESSFAAVASIP
jgi:hypothetical protein